MVSHKKNYFHILNLVILLIMLSACGDGEKKVDDKNDIVIINETNDTDNNNPKLRYTLARTTTIAAGEQCPAGGVQINSGVDENNNKRLDDTEIIETHIVCHGTSGYNSLIDITDEPEGEKCAAGGKRISTGLDSNQNSILDESEIAESSFVCNGLSGVNSTTDGTPGFNSLVDISEESSGDNCANGGKKINSGIDANRNNTLDVSEIDNTSYVCNGIDGNSGSGTSGYNSWVDIDDEPAGENCAAGGKRISTGLDSNQNSILDESEIAESSFVCNGLSGASSESGLNSLVDIADEVAGDNCVNGGKIITTGMDANRNDILDASEIDATSYVCNGADGNGGSSASGANSLVDIIDESAGANCTNGGKQISTGLDSNNNGTLDSSEVTNTSYVCNGLDGTTTSSPGVSCSISERPDGEKILNCSDGTLIPVEGGVVYQSSTVKDISGGKQIVDSWNTSGGRNRFSFRNNHYQIEVLSGSEVVFEIISNVINYFYLVDSLDIVVAEVSQNRMSVNLSPGVYTLVAATYYSDEQANYVLNIYGDIKVLGKVDSDVLVVNGNWETSGGRLMSSYRNDHYDFNVTKNTYLDITISTNISPYLYLINPTGMVIGEVSGNRLSLKAGPGQHRLVVATYYAGEAGSYVLKTTGNFENFIEKTSNRISFDDAWEPAGGRDRYSSLNPAYEINVTENSLVDITITSSVNNYMYLVDQYDIVAGKVSGDRLTAYVSTGRYKLVLATYYENVRSNFIVNIYGQVENLNKL